MPSPSIIIVWPLHKTITNTMMLVWSQTKRGPPIHARANRNRNEGNDGRTRGKEECKESASMNRTWPYYAVQSGGEDGFQTSRPYASPARTSHRAPAPIVRSGHLIFSSLSLLRCRIHVWPFHPGLRPKKPISCVDEIGHRRRESNGKHPTT